MKTRPGIIAFRALFCVLLLPLCAAAVLAGNGESVFPFLKISPSARAAGMGDAFVALADDASANYFNPAGLTQASRTELLFSHLTYVESCSYEYISVVRPLSEFNALGVHLSYFNYGRIDRTAEDSFGFYDPFASEGGFSSYDACLGLTYANKITDALSVGITLKYLRQRIEDSKLSGKSADVGLRYHTPIPALAWGINTQNVGSKVKGNKLPVNIKTGFLLILDTLRKEDLKLAFDANRAYDKSKKLRYSLGMEYNLLPFLRVRGGYGLGHALTTYTGGVSLSLFEAAALSPSFDYAFAPFDDFGNTHRISLTVKLGKRMQ